MGHPLTDVYASCITTGAKHDASLIAPLGYRLLVHGMSRGQTDDTGQPDSI